MLLKDSNSKVRAPHRMLARALADVISEAIYVRRPHLPKF
jgi:hypothetical protein